MDHIAGTFSAPVLSIHLKALGEPRDGDRPYPSCMTGLTNETTHAEENFRNKIVYRLRLDGYQGEIWFNVILWHRGQILRPDVFLPDVGLAIEVDGRRHDSNEWQLVKDRDRDDLYASMGIWMYRLSNHDAINEGKVNGRITEIMTLIRSLRNDFDRILKAKAAVERGHSKLLEKNPNLKHDLPNDWRTKDTRSPDKPMHHARWFGGIRMKLAPFNNPIRS